MKDGHAEDVGFLPALTVGTLFVFYLVWAAGHDIAHGEADTALEYAALIGSVPAFAWLYRTALLRLSPRAKAGWLGGTGLLLTLFNSAAIQSALHPKYAADSMLAYLLLTAGLPVLGLIGYHLVREAARLRTHPGA